MAKEKKVTIKEADITNNCPECFNQEMRLSFYQKHTFNAFFHRITNEVTHEIQCIKCGSLIYPVNWTPDIERVFDYYKKLVKPSKAKTTFTAIFYILIVLVLAAVITALIIGGHIEIKI